MAFAFHVEVSSIAMHTACRPARGAPIRGWHFLQTLKLLAFFWGE